jgi:predicted nuclease with TOPRIM domain
VVRRRPGLPVRKARSTGPLHLRRGHHHGQRNAAAKKKDLDALVKKWEDLRLKLEDVLARQGANQARLNELEKTKLAAENTQKELYAQYNRLEENLRKIQPGFVSFVRNLPVLDLANPSLKVNRSCRRTSRTTWCSRPRPR